MPSESGSKPMMTRVPPTARAKARYQARVRLSSAGPPPVYPPQPYPWWRMTTISGTAPGCTAAAQRR